METISDQVKCEKVRWASAFFRFSKMPSKRTTKNLQKVTKTLISSLESVNFALVRSKSYEIMIFVRQRACKKSSFNLMEITVQSPRKNCFPRFFHFKLTFSTNFDMNFDSIRFFIVRVKFSRYF